MADVQNLKTFEKVLKENYLPVWNNMLNIEPTPFLAKIKKKTLKSNKIVAAADIGLAGGFGFGEEGMNTPQAGRVRFERFETTAKDMYVDIGISAKAVRLTGSAGAMADALDTEIKGAYAAAKWNVGRSYFGNGSGVLCKVRDATTYSNGVITAYVNDVKMLKEGLTVDLYVKGGTTPDSNGTALRIKSIEHTTTTFTPAVTGDSATAEAEKVYKITLDGASANTSITKATISSGAESGGGFITVQNSYNREITGLGAIFDNNIAKIYGVDKASNPYLYPTVIGCDTGGVTNQDITRGLRFAQREKNSDVDMLLCGDDAFDAYVAYLETNKLRVEGRELEGGFKSIKFIFGNKEVDVVNEQFVPDGEMWGIDTSALELHTQEWNFCELQGGGIFNLKENRSEYRALLANYGELICKNPGGCVRFYNCAG